MLKNMFLFILSQIKIIMYVLLLLVGKLLIINFVWKQWFEILKLDTLLVLKLWQLFFQDILAIALYGIFIH